MMPSFATRWILACSFALAAAGFLLPWWPLSALGILLCALSGRWIWAVAMGLLLDVAYGAPVGRFYFLYFPFTLLAVVGALAYHFGARYFLDRRPPDTL